MAAAALVVRFQALLKPVTGGLEGAEMKCRDSGEMISFGEQRGIVDPTPIATVSSISSVALRRLART